MTIRVRDVKAAALREIKNDEARAVLRGVSEDYSARSTIDMMLKRSDDFPSPTMAMLAGVGVNPDARKMVDDYSDTEWSKFWDITKAGLPDEVVVGAGPHALIYAAIRKAKGVNVIVLEQSDKVGGSFACSVTDSFWLNSRNRPGELGLPGEGRGLNVFPGAPLQPAMIGGGEYQTNAELAWTVRMNFMLLGIEVHTGITVTGVREIRSGPKMYSITVKKTGGDSFILNTKRVVFCTGLGAPKPFQNTESSAPLDRAVDFPTFMSMMDRPFPLQGMNKVAVIGAGDSGKTVVEALLGMGPKTGMSVAGLDFVESIDWYGCQYVTQDQWCRANRGRYSRIGKALGTRVRPLDRARLFPAAVYEGAAIGPRAYDWIINCTGYTNTTPVIDNNECIEFKPTGRPIAKRYGGFVNAELYLAGPAARIDLTERYREMEPALAAIPQNSTSLFRYAPMTAALAATLARV